jgi:hypothetical protein
MHARTIPIDRSTARRSLRASSEVRAFPTASRFCAKMTKRGSGAAGNKFKMSLGLPVGAVMNCAPHFELLREEPSLTHVCRRR